MSNSNPNSSLEEQIKSLPRPDAATAKYLIEVELDDLVALVSGQRQEAKMEMADQLLTDLPVEPLESSRAEAADFRLAISATRDVINLAKANLDHQVQVNEDTDVLIKPDAGSDTDVTSKVAGKEVKFSHTAANLDIHMFIDGYHDPDVCPECIQPGLLVGSKS